MKREQNFPRSSGVLLHPTSLPGPYGIGNIGPAARRFVSWLAEAGQSLWQVCPLGPTGYGDSPYQSLSAFAGNPLLIGLDDLRDEGLLNEEDLPESENRSGAVDYARVIRVHTPVLQKAWQRFRQLPDDAAVRTAYTAFHRRQEHWLDEYALYAALKDEAGGSPWNEWDRGLRDRDGSAVHAARERLAEQLDFHRFIQFMFFRQWERLRLHAAAEGVRIIGDIPIFVAYDSAECWSRPELFQLDEERVPVAVAGVPPDYFSATGQRWGNPLYDWPRHEADNFQWWVSLLRNRFSLFDILRIDHFRGFAAYWRIPWGAPTAESGEWVPAPGRELFDQVFEQMGGVPVIAEDLGVITEDVVDLMQHCGFPGMKILQFGFDSGDENDYLPHSYTRHSVVYTGTHDNNTVLGWVSEARAGDLDFALRYMDSDGADVHWDFIRTALASVCCMSVIPMQDVLGLGPEARMNIPGTLGGNWQWRMTPDDLSDDGLALHLRELTQLYGRARS